MAIMKKRVHTSPISMRATLPQRHGLRAFVFSRPPVSVELTVTKAAVVWKMGMGGGVGGGLQCLVFNLELNMPFGDIFIKLTLCKSVLLNS